MYKIILRLTWPIILRYLTRYVDKYLQQRHEKQQQLPAPQSSAEALPIKPLEPTVSLPPYPAKSATAETLPAQSGDTVWFTLSGALVGAALAVIITILWRRED